MGGKCVGESVAHLIHVCRSSKHRIMKIRALIGKVVAILALIAAIPMSIVAAVLSLPIIAVMETKGVISMRIFRRREAGHVFLICTSKRNWHDFLRNNLIPVLPDNFRVVWQKSKRKGKYPDVIAHLARARILGVSKPYMVAVTPRAFRHKSLNPVLQELKTHPKKSEDAQRACFEIINQELNKLRTTP